METQRHNHLSRSHLLKMAMFTQRAVDYSIKSYELGAAEIQRVFWKHDQEWRELDGRIADRGSTLIADGTLADARRRTTPGCSSYSARGQEVYVCAEACLMLHPVFSLPIAASHRSTRLPCEAPVRAHLKDEEQQWNQVVKIMAAAVQST